jgi:hypothetical protein
VSPFITPPLTAVIGLGIAVQFRRFAAPLPCRIALPDGRVAGRQIPAILTIGFLHASAICNKYGA